jgi:hypothetical protein
VRPLGLLVAATAVALALASTALAYKSQPDAADRAFVEQAVLKLSDMPKGLQWSEGAKDQSDSPPNCPGYRPKESDLVSTGSANRTFMALGIKVTSDVTLLKTAKMVRTDWRRSFVPEFAPCLRHALVAGSGGSFHPVSVSELALPAIAPLTQAYRVVFTYKEGGSTGYGVQDFIALAGARKEVGLGVIANLGSASQQAAAKIGITKLDLRLARILAARAGLS